MASMAPKIRENCSFYYRKRYNKKHIKGGKYYGIYVHDLVLPDVYE